MWNGVNAAQRRKNGTMKMRGEGMVGGVKECGWCCRDLRNGMIIKTILKFTSYQWSSFEPRWERFKNFSI